MPLIPTPVSRPQIKFAALLISLDFRSQILFQSTLPPVPTVPVHRLRQSPDRPDQNLTREVSLLRHQRDQGLDQKSVGMCVGELKFTDPSNSCRSILTMDMA